MAEVIFKALMAILTATLATSVVSAIFKAADALERIADALEDEDAEEEEGTE